MSSITIKEGDKIPDGVLKYVPYAPELADNAVCGKPQDIKILEQWKGKKVVVVSVPGAFTPTCHEQHVPGFIKSYDAFTTDKSVDIVVIIAANDPFVMSAWGRVGGLPEKIIYASDPGAQWSEKLGLTVDLSHVGFGVRTQRYALIVDDLKVTYIGVESGGRVDNSSAEKVLAHL